MTADRIACCAVEDAVLMLVAKRDLQEVGAVGWAQHVGAYLIAPAVSHVVPFLHRAS